MSQVATKKKIEIRNERVKITAHFHEQGSVLRGDAEGFADGFEIAISLDSDAPETEVRELIRLARQMCFTEKALAGETSFTIRQELNGQELSG